MRVGEGGGCVGWEWWRVEGGRGEAWVGMDGGGWREGTKGGGGGGRRRRMEKGDRGGCAGWRVESGERKVEGEWRRGGGGV